MKKVSIYTDGACSGNPGPGGWGVVLRHEGGTRELSGGEAMTTNNRMELTAVIRGLAALKEPCEVELTSDSTYVVDSVRKGWVYNWRKKGWKKSDGSPALNVDLWQELLPLLERHKVSWNWIRGHSGHPENERCDELAVAYYTALKSGAKPASEAPPPQKTAQPCFVYADNAATTPIAPAVLEAMLPWLRDGFGNPSALYRKGREAREAVERARQQVAEVLGATPEEIVFTSGGTESVNHAIKSAARLSAKQGKNHIVTSEIEHPAVKNSLKALESEGFSLSAVGVGPDGIVSPKDIEGAIRPDTALVSVMCANNEIGTVQPVAEIGAVCRKHGVLFHTDAVQAFGHIPIDVNAQNIDLLSLSGHKIHAPKGVGALYIRGGLVLPAFIDGGGQERDLRSGTENVAGIVALGAAAQRMEADRDAREKKVRALRDRLLDGLLAIPRAHLNGSRDRRLSGNLNLSFEAIEGEDLLLELDRCGIAASAGAACSSASPEPSHVLTAIGVSRDIAWGALRISLSGDNTEEDVDYILEHLPPIVARLRAQSPRWQKLIQD